MAVVVVDIGGTNIRAAEYFPSTMRLGQVQRAETGKERSAQKIFETVCQTIDSTLAGQELEALGIAIPGTIRRKEGEIYSCGIVKNLDGFPIRKALERRYEQTFILEGGRKDSIPLILCNDGAAFTWGEYNALPDKVEGMMGVTPGTGFGTGHVANYELVKGRFYGAGEYGQEPHTQEDGKVDDICSGRWFEERKGIHGKEVLSLAKEMQHPAAIKVYREFGRNIAHALLYGLNAYAPEVVVIGGNHGPALPFYKDALLEELERNPRRRAPLPEIRQAMLEYPNLTGVGLLCEPYLATSESSSTLVASEVI